MRQSILIVDDDAAFRTLLAGVLETRGYGICHAGSGMQALATLRRSTVDLVVVDGLLPDGDGVSVVRSLRSEWSEIPVAFVCHFCRKLEVHNVLTEELGVSLVLEKPIDPALLADRIEEVMSATRSPAEVGPRPPGLPGLADARLSYARSLGDKVSEISAAVHESRRDGSRRARARLLAHRLAGTAGSYGFGQVGEAASRVEDLLVRAAAGQPVEESAWLASLADLAEASRTIEASDEADFTSSAVGLRVLLVDDDPAFLDCVAHLGRQNAIEVMTAQGEDEAIRVARRTRPEAAIIDIHLADGASPFELAHRLRALPGCEALPLAFVSVDGQVSSRVAAAHAGGSLYLSKPLDAGGLAAAVHQLVAAARSARPTVLMVDDDPDFVASARGFLEPAGLNVKWLDDPLRILSALDENRPDVVLVDAEMPGMSGLDVCRIVRTMPRWQELPILFVTGRQDMRTRLDAFQAGIDDYVTKPVLPEEFLARIRVRVERSRLIKERAERDPLTGLALRRLFLEQLTVRSSEARRHGRPFSLVLIDLDHFKRVNDSFGHLAGDRVLATMGRLLSQRLRTEDLRCRWGGEEFVLALAGADADCAARLVARLHEEVAALDFQSEEAHEFRVTFSAGVAAFPGDGDSLDGLLRAADRRLYAAKLAGRNQIIHQDDAS